VGLPVADADGGADEGEKALAVGGGNRDTAILGLVLWNLGR
jgi:hypothetical protein